eukprot:CAMPEP_0202698140 /NCGR_PEP_ID=MMETSP1385-20130828/11417_1 /ASSEMBLY_ACC=CAM_ASM_000861 /TAXON_ID=933848 /ORGANISM="Elphidium margaritaceum" /LENGTH=1549 /DNA_ID=CAMNT_0049354771 /DNA_START=775 /DNA_END=5424 /DNA_ORIENTATION=-
MSNLLVNKLSEFLSKVIKDYSKEQLNVSLLKGQIHLKDFEVDVNVINIYVEHYLGFLHINKLSVSDVRLSLPDVFHLSTKPTVISIGHIDIDCGQRDYTQPTAREIVGDDDFFLTASAPSTEDKDSYNLIKKVIDGARIEIDCIHIRLSLDGFPSEHESNAAQFHSNWFGSIDREKFRGSPMILDILLQNTVFAQTDPNWQRNDDLRLLRKSQGDRTKDFQVFKILSAQSFNVTLMPHPAKRTTKNSKKNSKPKKSSSSGSTYKKQQTVVMLIQNAPLDLRFIFQRKASDGIIKTISLQCLWRKLEVFITPNQYFDLNYFIASLLYAQAQQFVHERKDKDIEPSVSQSASVTVTQSKTEKEKKIDGDEAGGDGGRGDDDEDRSAVESHHLSSGKLLFDAMSLCQPPRFQWNKLPIYTTVSFRIQRFAVNIMPDDWRYQRPRSPRKQKPQPRAAQSANASPVQTEPPPTQTRQRGVSAGMKHVSKKTVQGIGKMGKGVGSVAKGVGKGIGSVGKGMKHAMVGGGGGKDKTKPVPNASPPPLPSQPPPPRKLPSTEQQHSASASNLQHSYASPNDMFRSTSSPPLQSQSQKHDIFHASRLGDMDRSFLLDSHLIPSHAIDRISVGDEYHYDPNMIGAEQYCKPLVLAILSDFSLGMIFPDKGYSIWRTRIGRSRIEQFFSVQVGDVDVLADTQLRDELQHQIRTGVLSAVDQLRKEQEKIDAQKEKEFTPEPVSSSTNADGGEKSEKQKQKQNMSVPTSTARARSKSDPEKPSHIDTDGDAYVKTKSMTLLISSRHYKTQTFTHAPYKFTVDQPFPGYNPQSMTVFNYQWTRRIPAPTAVLAQMNDMHIKPVCIYLDPFLIFNCVRLLTGNGVIKVYQMQAALSTFDVAFERFASRYLLDAVKIIIPIGAGSRVSASIHNLRLSSHDQLDETVHERGLVDLSNFSSVGKHSLRAMGLGNRIVDEIQKMKQSYVDEVNTELGRSNSRNSVHFSATYDHRLRASMAPGVSAILRPPDEYPWEINIGHLSLASVVQLDDNRYDNEIQILNCRMRYVMIRSDSVDDNILLSSEIEKPFVETQISFRTDSVEGSIDTTVIEQVMAKIDYGGIAELPLPALFNKIKEKIHERQQRADELRKFKTESLKKQLEDELEEKRLAKQQKRRLKTLKAQKAKLEAADPNLVKHDLLLSQHERCKHSDVREIELSDSEIEHAQHVKNGSGKLQSPPPPQKQKIGVVDEDDEDEEETKTKKVLDLDMFIEGVLDGIGGNESSDEDENSELDDDDDGDERKQTTPNAIPSDLESDSESQSQSKRSRGKKTGSAAAAAEGDNNTEYRLIIYSNLDRGEFQLTNNGVTQIKGKTRSQQLLCQWTQEILNFHFFSTELKLYESPIGKYQEHDVVTRFSRAKDGRMWSEVVHDEPDGAIEMTFPPSLQRIAEKTNDRELQVSPAPNKNSGNIVAVGEGLDMLKRDKQELLQLIRYITLENRVMQTRVLQLASDLSVARDDMKRFVKQTSEDKLRIVEHQQFLITDNMELQKQIQVYKKKIKELQKNQTK